MPYRFAAARAISPARGPCRSLSAHFHKHAKRDTAVPFSSTFSMSTDLPFFEGQVDALVNTMWWSLDEKFGRTTRPRVRSNPTTLTRTLDDFQRIWDSVAMRLSLAFFLPHFLKSFVEIESPYRIGMVLVLVCVIWPWVYSILIYLPFLDPLRKLPAPKVFTPYGL